MANDQNSTSLNPDILIVDDEISNLQMLTKLLADAGYQIRTAKEPEFAIESAMAQPPNLIMLDVKGMGMDGFEVCKCLKQDKRTRGIPIIFIGEPQDLQDKVGGSENWGMDYIAMPFRDKEVLTRVRTHMELHRLQLDLDKMVEQLAQGPSRTSRAILGLTGGRAALETK